MSPDPISRRALILAGIGAATVAAGATGSLGGFDRADGAAASRLQPTAGEPLRHPNALASNGGRLAVELTAAPGATLAGQPTAALGYNGSSPGPTLRVRPGDELAVRLTNRLDQPTNLHTDGPRVSPQANSDNPFVRVDPGTSFDYLFRVPLDHPAGTYWYHPHHHGTVAELGDRPAGVPIDRCVNAVRQSGGRGPAPQNSLPSTVSTPSLSPGASSAWMPLSRAINRD